MEHLCQKCRAGVEDGTAFCPACGAPQIKITATILNRPAPPPPSTEAPVESQTGAAVPTITYTPPPAVARVPAWSEVVPGAIVAGAMLAAASVVPFAAPLLLMLAAGGFSVFFYMRRAQVRLTPRAAARVGAMGGVTGFVLMAVIMVLAVMSSGGQVVEMLRQAMLDKIGQNPPAQAQELIQQLMTPAGLATIFGIGLLVILVLILLVSAAGGAIAAALLNKKK